MRTYKNVIIPSRTESRLSEIKCNCGKTRKIYGVENWSGDSYEVDKVTVKIETGESYPESSSMKTTTYDICPECFDKFIKPVLDKLGFKPHESSIDF